MGVKRHPVDACASSRKPGALKGTRVCSPRRTTEEGTEFDQTSSGVGGKTAGGTPDTGRLPERLFARRPGTTDESREEHGEGGEIATHSERLSHASLLWPSSLTALAE